MSNTSKVMVTGESGQNNLLYLPLDKMINSRGTGSSGTSSVVPGATGQSTPLPPELDPREVRTRESR